MEVDWSEQSPHIRTLYHPWQPGDGYEESIIAAVEAQLGLRLPNPLRTFYQAWGRRKDLTRTQEYLFWPPKLVRRPEALIFCGENQGGVYWAIERQALEEPDPPVVPVDPDDVKMDGVSSPCISTPDHAHVSDFLDTLTYHHALCGGAIHGGWTGFLLHRESQDVWLKQNWQRATAGALFFARADHARLFGLEEDETSTDPPLYVRDGQALVWGLGCSVAARSAEALDEIGQTLQMRWQHRW